MYRGGRKRNREDENGAKVRVSTTGSCCYDGFPEETRSLINKRNNHNQQLGVSLYVI